MSAYQLVSDGVVLFESSNLKEIAKTAVSASDYIVAVELGYRRSLTFGEQEKLRRAKAGVGWIEALALLALVAVFVAVFVKSL